MAKDTPVKAHTLPATPSVSPVQDMANTGDGRKLIEQAMGITGKASDTTNLATTQYDYRGDPAEVATLSPEDAQAGNYGNSGTVIFAGFIAQEEYNAKLIGRQGLLKYDEMRKSDSTVRWSLQVLKLPIRAAQWRMQAASDDPKDQEIADFVEWNLFERISWTSLIREIMTYLDFGFFVGEKSYVAEDYQPKQIKVKPDPKPKKPPLAPVLDPATGMMTVPEDPDDIADNDEPQVIISRSKPMIVMHDLANRKQTTIFRWEQGDGSPGVTQVTAQGTFDIPENRLFILTHEREGNNYYGVSILRSAYKHWYMKDALYKIAAVAAERQGVGVVKIQALSKPNATELAKAVDSAENLRASDKGYLVEPDNFSVNFMDMMTRGTVNTGPDIEHHNRQIMVNVGAAFMEMGATRQAGATGGSKSASGDQSKVYEQAVEAIANEIEEAFNTMVIRQLVDLNYTGITNYPKLKHNSIGEDDLSGYAAALKSFADADLLTPDAELEQSIRDRADLPDLPYDIANDYENRDRSQASTVPQFGPAVPPGGAAVDPITGKPTTPKVAATTTPLSKSKTPPEPAVKASELTESVKRMYAIIGDGLDAIERED